MNFSKFFRAAFSLIIGFVLATGAFALTITKGPYLQNPTASGMVVMWETDEASSSRVDFGATTSYGGNVYSAALTTTHEVTVTGLTTDTLYHYKVTSKTSAATKTSADNTFRAAPAYATPFRFVAYGDSRSYPEVHAKVVAGIVAAAPRLVLHTGDFTNNGTTAADWQSDFFGPAAPLIKNTPLYPALGNHENNSALYYRYFSPPAGGGDYGEQWYAFDYGNARFMVLDTDVSFAPGSAQYTWLENELQNATAEWLVVVEHHPPYSSGDHGSDVEAQNYLVPLYETYGVDLVFCGHDHLYERSLKNGVNYIVTGGGSGPLSTPNTNPNPYQQLVESVNHYCTVDINGATAVLQAHYTDGTVFDTLTLSHGALPALPVADFSATPRSGTAPLTVAFTNTTTGGATSWSWTFGDGGTSTSQNPTHQYTAAGTYTVRLIATNAAGSDGETKTGYIVVSAAPPTTYTLTLNVSGGGNVSANPTPGPYTSGTQVALTATPATGWKFNSWSGAVAAASAPSTTITMTANRTVTAQFGPATLPKAASKLTAATYSMSQIRLTWQDNANNEAGFKIERRLGKSGVWSPVGQVGENVSFYTDSGLQAGATYSYRVRAYNSLGDGKYSKAKSGKTFALAAPGGLIAAAVSASQINLSWADNSSDEVGFKIERRAATSSSWSTIKTVGANVTSYSNTGLKAGTQYYYRVRAYKANGGYSDYSNEAGGKTG